MATTGSRLIGLKELCRCPRKSSRRKDLGTSVADVWHRALEVNYSSYGRALLDWHQKVSYEQDCSNGGREACA